ncbi:hypothetical protein PILCRDRAFT_798488 [Piloderma croceum F 1598]|uniref:MYND-type domain-containing protein n=1 Tax=Piloderma croceum (strain F 1598) TaxID=765440 RepID=A0A0C3BFB0_PILCF|nr:hypothetical protein PILCRDRAFT_798488 [Piloderma croceum F 1598]
MSTPRFTSIADAKANGAICGFCRVTGAEKRLNVCARCKSAQHGLTDQSHDAEQQQSRDCQKKAWKYHKVICKNGDEMPVQKWGHRHSPVLFWACFNAYDLGRHPERGETHVMIIQLQQTGNAKKVRNMFSLVDAYLLLREELAVSRPQDMEVIASGEREHALRETKDRVVSCMLLDYSFSAHWIGPLWDKEELAQRTTDPDWCKILKSITDGKTEYEMVDGNAVRKDASSYFLFLHQLFN